MMDRSRAAMLLAAVAMIGCGGGAPPAPQPIGLAGLPPTITVSEWPFWVDIPIESKDYDRTWKTLIDIVSERAAIGVLDKESGYVRTEWRPVDIATGLIVLDSRGRPSVVAANSTGEQRYTFRIRQADS